MVVYTLLMQPLRKQLAVAIGCMLHDFQNYKKIAKIEHFQKVTSKTITFLKLLESLKALIISIYSKIKKKEIKM
jgi:hypothetical protein